MCLFLSLCMDTQDKGSDPVDVPVNRTVRMIGTARVKNETSEVIDIPETSSTCTKKIQLGKQEMVKKNKPCVRVSPSQWAQHKRNEALGK